MVKYKALIRNIIFKLGNNFKHNEIHNTVWRLFSFCSSEEILSMKIVFEKRHKVTHREKTHITNKNSLFIFHSQWTQRYVQ